MYLWLQSMMAEWSLHLQRQHATDVSCWRWRTVTETAIEVPGWLLWDLIASDEIVHMFYIHRTKSVCEANVFAFNPLPSSNIAPAESFLLAVVLYLWNAFIYFNKASLQSTTNS